MFDHSFRHVELWSIAAQPQQNFCHKPTLIGREALDIGGASLRREDAHQILSTARLADQKSTNSGRYSLRLTMALVMVQWIVM